MTRLFAVPLTLALVAGASPQAQQKPAAESQFQLAAIEGKGLERLSRDDLAALTGLTVGKPIRLDELQPAAERLAASGLVETLEYRFVTAAGRLTLTFDLVEAARVVPVIFDNFVWFSDAQLAEAVRTVVPGFDGLVPQKETVPDRIIGALQKTMTAAGLPGSVAFMPQTELRNRAETNKTLQFVFKVENPSPVTCSVSLAGVSPRPREDLERFLAPLVGQPYSRFYITGLVEATLIDAYRRLGYWKATFAPHDRQVDAGCKGVSVGVSASEGSPYQWQGAIWRGNSALNPAELDKHLGMRSGQLADLEKIRAGLRQVAKAYGRLGYVQAQASLEPRLDDEARRATFEINVTEGQQFRMGRLEVAGFSEGDAESLRRSWRLKPGDVYDASYVDEFVRTELSRRRRPDRPAPRIEFRLDAAEAVVNVRILQN